MTLDPWYVENLVCPVEHSHLRFQGGKLVSPAGRTYPVADGIPVMLVPEAEQTIGVAFASLQRANGELVDERAPELHLESLGISESEKLQLLEFVETHDKSGVDPAVAFLIGATNGLAYRQRIGDLDSLPIPELRLPAAEGATFLDIGCNWGRWSIAAARRGYHTVGIDPSLGAVMAARRVAKKMDLPIHYLVADARFLPFKSRCFDIVYSYSVLQHLSKDNVRTAVPKFGRVLRPNGTVLIQMPNFLGVRCLQHQARRRFREPRGFEVRYWSLSELRKLFEEAIGKTEISVDCFFGLGLQKSDLSYMMRGLRYLTLVSETLRKTSEKLPVIRQFADSVYVKSTSRQNTA